MFRIGSKVKVARNNDNDNYDDFRNKVLKLLILQETQKNIQVMTIQWKECHYMI